MGNPVPEGYRLVSAPEPVHAHLTNVPCLPGTVPGTRIACNTCHRVLEASPDPHGEGSGLYWVPTVIRLTP